MEKFNRTYSFLIIITLLTFFSCAGPKVIYDYDKTTNFSAYKTFDFYPNLQLDMNQLDSTRVIEQLESVLLLKGFTKSSNPNFYVNIMSEQFETPSNKSIGIGIGTGGRNIGVGVSGGIPIRSNTLTQLFKVDLIDVTKDILIWQATYEGKFNLLVTPDERSQYLKLTFENIFSKYPPSETQN